MGRMGETGSLGRSQAKISTKILAQNDRMHGPNPPGRRPFNRARRNSLIWLTATYPAPILLSLPRRLRSAATIPAADTRPPLGGPPYLAPSEDERQPRFGKVPSLFENTLASTRSHRSTIRRRICRSASPLFCHECFAELYVALWGSSGIPVRTIGQGSSCPHRASVSFLQILQVRHDWQTPGTGLVIVA